ncbi:uncharacterized protein MELLADRAFT_74086 [Melampsora larici-populina 98AG31]|uniref:ABC transporter domain-containing protein n=1 Tax=Melampsora larici-populina (strain 98AG31 / pathotype 3-4-7) TaxID=747676 RepID=F4R755_MELLP|nr:uncharacterized protein MELLADRAFT_74086 [Melampsora larici-populina 98AG31]EGG11574.1 hypothetical protein MELLADRAFT_74086 [Melampsora larici-populina 98AG31]
MSILSNRRSLSFPFLFCLFIVRTYCQSCQDLNQTGSNCVCLPGFTNSPECNTLACGNPFVDASKRPALIPSSAGSGGSKGCGNQCTTGFTGTSCNICTSSDACQAGISSLSSGSQKASPLTSATQDMICSNEPSAFGVNFGQCDIENPTLNSLFPGKIWATAQRNPDPSAAPLPTSLLSALTPNSLIAQLWYAPNTSTIAVEQFFCIATNCTQEIKQEVDINACPAMKCRCIPGTAMCGGGPLDITHTINDLTGELTLECPISNTSSSCSLKTETIKALLGPNGFTLTNCHFGECIQQSVVDMKRKLLYHLEDNSLSTGLIVGIVIILAVIAALLALVLFGFWQQRQARHPQHPSSPLASGGAARLVWQDLRYVLEPKGSSSALYHRLRSTVGPKSRSKSHHLRMPSIASTANHPVLDEKGGAVRSPSFSIDTQIPVPSLSTHQDCNRHQHKVILRGLSGAVEPGTMMAILGPSGAGKSTFLDILAGQRKAGRVTGSHSISLPGSDAASDDGFSIGFVDQSDILPATATVREALLFAAKLKLPEDISDEKRDLRVAEVIDSLGLAHVAHSRVGDDEVRGLSGGERRRLSIGLEMISCPSILFLDEPTSGLDSVSALRVVNVLKALSINAPEGCGTTIVCSIHQPSSQIYHSFDYICLLALGGRQIYCGKTLGAVDFIASHGLECPQGYNMADYLLEVASDPPAMLLDQANATNKALESYPASIQSTPVNYLEKTRPRTTTMTQFQCLSKREWTNLKRDPGLFWMHAIIALVTGIFVGAMYFQVKLSIAGFQNRIGSLFFLASVIAFSALSALNNFLTVRLLFMRERAGRFYSPAAWLLSRLFFDIIPLRVIPALMMGIIMYYMVGLDSSSEHVLKFLLVVLQLSIVQTLFNLFLAAVFKQQGLAILLASLTNLLQMAFAGFFVNLSSLIPLLRWIQYLAPFKFALEAMTVNEVGTGLMIKDTISGVNIQTSASMIMNLLFGFKPDAYYRDVIALFGFMAALVLFLVIAVYYKLRQTR